VFSTDFVQRLQRHIGRRVASSHDRDDILQETLARVIARINMGLLALAEIEPYSFRVASNLIADSYRRRGPQWVEMPEGMQSPEPEPARVLEARQELDVMLAVIRGMPPLRRRVFMSIRVDGQSYKAVSRELGISEKAVEKHMTRALADIVRERRRLGPGQIGEAQGGRDD
jgi:RNA polymerase sigma factor (sigma-70 family)